MKLSRLTVLALLMFIACPAVSFAQYHEIWSGPGTFAGNGYIAQFDLTDLDGDSANEMILNVHSGGQYHVQIRDPLTGAIKFTSPTGDYNLWKFYPYQLDGSGPLELICASPDNVIVIGYGGSVAAPASDARGMRETLLPARPNPFGSHVSLSYTLATTGSAELEIFDVAGRVVRRLGGDRQQAGEHQVEWDGRDSGGRTLDPGMYFYRLNVDGRASEARKAIRLGQ